MNGAGVAICIMASMDGRPPGLVPAYASASVRSAL
jgi:hypothetical protein